MNGALGNIEGIKRAAGKSLQLDPLEKPELLSDTVEKTLPAEAVLELNPRADNDNTGEKISPSKQNDIVAVLADRPNRL